MEGQLEGQLSVFDVLMAAPVIEPVEVPRATLKPLTLDEVRALEPFRSHVWIENREFGKGCFLELFPADVSLFGQSIYTGRDVFHFSYTYTNGRRYDHSRVDEFYGREWRVWPDRPTDEERMETPWNET